MKKLYVLSWMIPCLGLCLYNLGCRPRKGFRADPNKPRPVEEKHIPQRYIDRFELREKLEELQGYFQNHAQNFELGYRRFLLRNPASALDFFLLDFLLVVFDENPPCQSVPGYGLKMRHVYETEKLVAISKQMIRYCFADSKLSDCPSKMLMHLHETEEILHDPNLFYKVRTGYFPILGSENVVRIVRIDLTFRGSSNGEGNHKDVCELLVNHNFFDNKTWEAESDDDYHRVAGDESPIYGLQDVYPQDVHKLINFVLECPNNCFSLRVVEIVGKRETDNADIVFTTSPAIMMYYDNLDA